MCQIDIYIPWANDQWLTCEDVFVNCDFLKKIRDRLYIYILNCFNRLFSSAFN